MLAAESGSNRVVRAHGIDADAAVEALTGLINRGFDDDESEYAPTGEEDDS